MIDKCLNNNRIIAFVMALLLCGRHIVGLIRGDLMWINYLILLVAGVTCLLILVKKKDVLLDLFKNLGFIWIIAINIMLFIYGRFVGGPGAEAGYSRSYQMLSFVFVAVYVFLMVFVWMKSSDNCRVETTCENATVHKGNVTCTGTTTFNSLIYDIACFTILGFSAYTIGFLIYRFDYIRYCLVNGYEYRLGITFETGVIETSMMYALCLVPLIYSFWFEKNRNALHIISIVLGLIFLACTGSKTGMLAVLFSIFIFAVFSAETRKKRLVRLLIFIVVVGAAVAVCMCVPILYQTLGYRIEEVFTTIVAGTDAIDWENSTSRRLGMMKLAFKEAWDKPIFGHGTYSFAYQVGGYDEVEGVYVNSHSTFSEVLYSYGLFGFALYYAFPVYVIIKTIRCKDKPVTMFATAMIASLLICELGNITIATSMLCYVFYTFLYMLLRRVDYDKTRN